MLDPKDVYTGKSDVSVPQVCRLVSRVAAWEVSGTGPQSLQPGRIDLEEKLEDWISKDPNLVQRDLVVIGRQITLDSGRARLDLLALDPQGTWVVIEVKRGSLSRDVIAQVIDYAAYLASMNEREIVDAVRRGGTDERRLRELLEERGALDSLQPEARDLAMVIVGAEREPGLERVANFLSGRFNIALKVVTFQVFTTAAGTQVLVRELSETDLPPPPPPPPTPENLLEMARRNGIGEEFKTLVEAGQQIRRLCPRVYRTSVMFAPQENRTRCVYTVWATPSNGKVRLYLSEEAFSDFFGIEKGKIKSVLGEGGWRFLSKQDALDLASRLKTILGSEPKEG